MTTTSPEIIPVIINGKSYPSTLDEHGVQRFIPNPIIKLFVDESLKAWRNRQGGDPIPFGLNSISYEPGDPYSLDELIQFTTLHGYSVSGMCDLSFMEGVDVINPLWGD